MLAGSLHGGQTGKEGTSATTPADVGYALTPSEDPAIIPRTPRRIRTPLSSARRAVASTSACERGPPSPAAALVTQLRQATARPCARRRSPRARCSCRPHRRRACGASGSPPASRTSGPAIIAYTPSCNGTPRRRPRGPASRAAAGRRRGTGPGSVGRAAGRWAPRAGSSPEIEVVGDDQPVAGREPLAHAARGIGQDDHPGPERDEQPDRERGLRGAPALVGVQSSLEHADPHRPTRPKTRRPG